MRRLIVFIVILILTGMNMPRAYPSANKPLLFIGQDRDSILDYAKHIGAPEGFMIYTSIQNVEGLSEPKDSGAGVQDADFILRKFPKAKLQIGLYMVGALDDIVQGKYDENIKKLAAWFDKASVPIFLRIGYEFDGPHNHYDPEKYVNAYRYIVDKCKSLGVKDVLYVWHSYAAYVEGDILRWYPGDEYVDWIGISYFNAYNKGSMERVSKIARNKNKPLMIAEATPRGFNVARDEKVWKLWFEQLFSFMVENNVKALCYINTNWEDAPLFRGQGWGDARIQINEVIKNRWLSWLDE